MLQRIKNMRMFDKYKSNQQDYIERQGFGNKLMGGVSKVADAYASLNGIKQANQALTKFRTPKMPSADFASKVGATEGLQNLGTGMDFKAPTTNLGVNTSLSQAPNLQTGELASKIGAGSKIADTAGTASKATGAMSGAMQGFSKAMPVVGTAMGLYSAGDNFAKGNHIDGAMDLAKTGAMFIPGVGWAVAGAIQIAQMLKGMKDKKDQKAMANAEKASQEEQQQSLTNMSANKQEMDQIKADNQQAMSEQLQKNNLDTSSGAGTDSLYEIGTNTPLEQQTPLKTDELGAQEGLDPKQQKYVEQYGVGYDPNEFNTRDRYKWDMMRNSKGTLTGPASDITKGPLPVDGSASKYIGQEQQYNDAVANMPELPLLQMPQEEQSMAQTPVEADPKQGIWDLLNSKLGNVTEAVASIPGATSKMLDKVGLDHLANIPRAVSSGLNDFSAGYKDNTQTSFSQGDLAKKFQQPQEEAPKQLPDGTYDVKADEMKKSLMTRLGEMAGTGQRIASHPLTQAGIAGLVSKMAGGDVDDIAKAMYDYGTKKAEADRYYQMTTGKTDRPFLNTYGADDYKTKVQKDQWQQEHDWKVAKDQRDYELNKDIHDTRKAQGGYARYGSFAGDKLAWEQEKFNKNTMLKLLQDQHKQAIDALGDSDTIYVPNEKKTNRWQVWESDVKPVSRADKINEINKIYEKRIRQLLNGEDVDLTAPPTTTQAWQQDEDGFYR
jgi:hypothetical protein